MSATEPDASRPQDVGRRRSRKGAPSAATLSLLADYHEAMRGELRAILGALGAMTEPGILPDVPPALAIPLDDPKRDRLWDRGVKLGRELGAEIDPGPATPAPVTRTPRRPKRVDYGGA